MNFPVLYRIFLPIICQRLDSAETTMPNRRKFVAVVDDDPSTLEATEGLLDALGFSSACFPSAEEFLTHSTAAPLDCLLLDIHLGGISGIELRRKLTALRSELPVIFMTARNDEAVRREAFEVGCIDCLRKPFLARQLIDAIEKALA